MKNLWALPLALLLCVSCEDKPAEDATPASDEAATTSTAAQTAEQEAAAKPAGDGEVDYASFADDAWCPTAFGDTQKIVEAMKATMKRAGSTTGQNDDEYAMPSEERYLELCGKLPIDMQKCLVIGFAARNRDACQASLEKLDPPAKEAYGELMGR